MNDDKHGDDVHVDNLRDFRTNRRVILLSIMAIPIGALSAVVAKVLIWLIAIITNISFFARVSSAPVTPQQSHFGWYLIIAVPVIGALIIEPGQLYLTIKYTNGYLSEILLGVLFLLIVLFMPRGLVPTASEWIKRARTRGRPVVPPASQRPAVPQPGNDAPTREART